VDPEMTVRQSHEIAGEVKNAVKKHLNWVADVLVHVEPFGLSTEERQRSATPVWFGSRRARAGRT